jgi:hypothetical protein
MGIVNHIKEHAMLGLTGAYSGLSIPVSSAAELAAQVASYGDRKTLRVDAGTPTLTLTNGSPTVTGGGTAWRATTPEGILLNPRIDDLILFGSDTRYYKIKSVDLDTQLTLYEDYAGSNVTTTATAMKTYYMSWVSFVLMPGEYALGIAVYPGQSFVGIDRHACIVSEESTTPPTPFTDWGENRLSNLTIAPTNDFGTVDGLFTCARLSGAPSKVWGGMESIVSNCTLSTMNLNGAHNGGEMRLPLFGGGKSTITGCSIVSDNPAGFGGPGGAVDPTSANAIVNLHNNLMSTNKGFENGTSFASPIMFAFSDPATYNIDHATAIMEDLAVSPSSFVGSPGSMWVPSTGLATPPIINISHLTSRVVNNRVSGTSVPACIQVDGEATVNISQSDLDAQGTGAQTIRCTHASAVINVRGSRISGGTNSIDCSAGIVNVDTASTLIGATTGAGTINTSTDT